MKINYDKWCNKCVHYEFDLKEGIICGLTKEKPKFVEVCPYFKPDENRINYVDLKEKERQRRERLKNEPSRFVMFDYLYEKKLLLPFFVILSFISIYYFDSSKLKSLIITFSIVFYTIYLIFSTRIIPKNIRYVYIEDNHVKDIVGPGIVTVFSINKYKKIDLNVIAPDLINEKYDFKLKKRINEYLKNQSLDILSN